MPKQRSSTVPCLRPHSLSPLAGLLVLVTAAGCTAGEPAQRTAATPAPRLTASTAAAGSPAAPTPTASPSAPEPNPDYLDDRSSPQALLNSLADAINQKQFARAYAYWEPSPQLPPFSEFEQSYAGAATVRLTFSEFGNGVAAGQIYYTVPVTLETKTVAGAAHTSAGCYTLHIAQPDLQDAVPYQPLAIQSSTVKEVPGGARVEDLLATACQGEGFPQTTTVPPLPTPDPVNIEKSRYLDDRSGPVRVIRSLFNAINRKEYVRAYSYWEPSATTSQLPAYPQFKQGYEKTASVRLITGTVASNPGAGQRLYSVPVTLTATTTDGATQTFVGCYRLQQESMAFQVAPPFRPLSIRSATLTELPRDAANASDVMQRACEGV